MTDEEKRPYHTIMVDAWRLFIKDRSYERFSDDWWNEIISDYDKLRDTYKGTIYNSYCSKISQAFLDEMESIMKRTQVENPDNNKIFSNTDWQ